MDAVRPFRVRLPMFYVALLIAIVLVLVLFVMLRPASNTSIPIGRKTTPLLSVKSESELRKVFDGNISFVGRDLEFLLAHAGQYAFGGSMDRGQDLYQWRAGAACVEVWFQDGKCTEINAK
jgi:hypothetical protein